MVAMLFVVEPPLRGGLKKRLLSGTPLGVSKATLRLSASRTACFRMASTWAVLLEWVSRGPVRIS
jgi:hypothetical protein